ncbi:hypothetical protein [uncultured Winogradskyella sp.]|uniref:hypothetical protein n=1 Tax=uncultured Winogradskyella sp. TaxID=395353 RepID=UPI002603BBBD|nr:hypothetical protein [uncultured Winogradskyella sp.]
MKKGIVLILFLIVSLTGFAQQDVVNNEIVKPEATKVSVSAKVKAKVLKMNRKKSNEIISIKAYRKSLQIRVKTKKLC